MILSTLSVINTSVNYRHPRSLYACLEITSVPFANISSILRGLTMLFSMTLMPYRCYYKTFFLFFFNVEWRLLLMKIPKTFFFFWGDRTESQHFYELAGRFSLVFYSHHTSRLETTVNSPFSLRQQKNSSTQRFLCHGVNERIHLIKESWSAPQALYRWSWRP